MSSARFMIVGADGSERGPFEIAELRWMWRRNQIDDGTMLKAEGAALAVRAKAMAGQLDAAGEEIEVVFPTLEAEPPELPAAAEVPGRSGGPVASKLFLGLNDWQWAAIGVALLVVLTTLHATLTFDPEKARADKARMEEAAKAEEAWTAMRMKAIEFARADAAMMAKARVKPTQGEIYNLAGKRAAQYGLAANDYAVRTWLMEYESMFKVAYRREAGW